MMHAANSRLLIYSTSEVQVLETQVRGHERSSKVIHEIAWLGLANTVQ